MRYLAALLPIFTLLSACSSKPAPVEASTSPGTAARGGFLLKPALSAGTLLQPAVRGDGLLNGDFSANPQASLFVEKMVREHGFDRLQLQQTLAQARQLDWVIRLMDQQAPVAGAPSGPNGAWLRYRSKFITPDSVQNGVAFWNQYEDALQRAWREYGVPPEIIVGIIGVETRWGRVMGKTRIIDALATLAFAYPRRAEYFAGELETFLLMAQRENDDPFALSGSYAGAMGYGQFMPSSYKNYAVDFNGDGHINLWDPVDAIGSVANYFKAHGWVQGGAVAVPATGQASTLASGINTRYALSTLAAAGLRPQGGLGGYKEASLLRLDTGSEYQYWYGLPNFFVITRYNRSVHYSMAVWQLGEVVNQARHGQSGLISRQAAR
ncbi:lytic murein transglycosylase B [Affinibrenneria salicis]|uniref:Lytic murein transglycosylase B n=1 Tax=Affinibrenneria salicis TaxID=2590031 RepID=A0A5J5FR82_9GAMM|nr:lytic murein transglycosylase B [Affinibrenneria salicis]KAA8995627.1 lytic murein transglycosylase B [Affinibrenneria salicis]